MMKPRLFSLKHLPLVLFALVLAFTGSASAYVYDDFSDGVLNTTLWSEQYTLGGFVNEHFVDNLSQNYHTAQLVPEGSGRSVLVTMLAYNFTPGRTLDFDVFYNSGSGNRMHRIWLNGIPLDYILPPQLGCGYCGAIGFWGQEMDMGNQLGRYHYRIFFKQNSITIGLKRPDRSLYNATITLAYPIVFGFETITGHDGVAHFDYDNFVIRRTR